MKTKLTLVNNHEDWNPKRRYKVNALVRYNNSDWQNTTGINTEPGTDSNWVCTSNQRAYKVYTAQFGLNDTSSGIEFINVFENTIGEIDITYAFGEFNVLSSGLFTINKTYVSLLGGGDSIDSMLYLYETMTDSDIKFYKYGDGNNLNNHIEIRVYN